MSTTNSTTKSAVEGQPPQQQQQQQLVVAEGVAEHLPPAERPVIVFNQLSDAQFDRALALFTPAPRTKTNLWTQKTYARNLVKVASYCESAMYARPGGECFSNKYVTTNFDNCMIQRFRNDNPQFFFSVNEWFNDTRGDIPAELLAWDPNGVDVMPQVETGVDWYKELTETDMQFEGFLDLFANCIDLEEEMAKEVANRKHASSTAFGDHPGTRMPAPINQHANFDNFTATGLMRPGGGSGLYFDKK